MASTKLNSNDANAESRLDIIKHMFTDISDLQVCKITPIAYEEGFPFPYNNFVYAVSVNRSGSSKVPPLFKQPGTQAIPLDETTFIFRLPNPISGYNDNFVLRTSHLIPRVYGWNSAKSNEGRILQQYMSGERLLERFPSFDIEEKTNALSQMADILACFQCSRPPVTISKYGVGGFDNSGKYISTALSLFKAGPFATYEELLRATSTSKLEHPDIDPRVKGWREIGIRKWLDRFLTKGLSEMFHNVPLALEKVLSHADFSIDNVLYDSSNKKLTALFDFDFGYVGSVTDELFLSFGHDMGRFPSSRDKRDEIAKLRNAMLHGFPDPLLSNSEEVDWAAARAWDDALKERNLQRPATIPNIRTLAEIYWLSSQILPFKLCNEVVVGNSTDEQLKKRKEYAEALLNRFLTEFGY